MSERAKFYIGLAVGLVALCICIEATKVVFSRPPLATFDAITWWIGRFRWLYDYQTIIAGAAALYAARWSVRAIESQIQQADDANKAQLAQVEQIEADRKDARRSAARAVLPLALASVSQYAERTAETLRVVHPHCVGGVLPAAIPLPTFPGLPENIITPIKEMIEAADKEDRSFIWQMLVRIQVLQSRISSLVSSHARPGSFVTSSNLEAYILDAAEIYARASRLFEFARGAAEHPPSHLINRNVAQALSTMGVFDDLHDELVRRFDLDTDRKWGERWLSRQ